MFGRHRLGTAGAFAVAIRIAVAITPAPPPVPPTPVPDIVPSPLEAMYDIASACAAMATIGNAVTGGTASALAPGRVETVLRGGSDCRAGEADPELRWLLHPLRSEVLGTEAAGAVVWNLILTLIIFALHGLLFLGALACTCGRRRERPVRTAAAWTRFPSYTLALATFLLPGIAVGSSHLILHVKDTPQALIGTLGACWIFFLCGCMGLMSLWAPQECKFLSPAKETWRTPFNFDGSWGYGDGYLYRWGFAFWANRGDNNPVTRAGWGTVELLFQLVLTVLCTMRGRRELCVASQSLACVALLAHSVAMPVLRPMRSVAVSLVLSTISLCAALCAAMLAHAYDNSDGDSDYWSRQVAGVCGVISQFLLTLSALVTVFLYLCRSCCPGDSPLQRWDSRQSASESVSRKTSEVLDPLLGTHTTRTRGVSDDEGFCISMTEDTQLLAPAELPPPPLPPSPGHSPANPLDTLGSAKPTRGALHRRGTFSGHRGSISRRQSMTMRGGAGRPAPRSAIVRSLDTELALKRLASTDSEQMTTIARKDSASRPPVRRPSVRRTARRRSAEFSLLDDSTDAASPQQERVAQRRSSFAAGVPRRPSIGKSPQPESGSPVPQYTPPVRRRSSHHIRAQANREAAAAAKSARLSPEGEDLQADFAKTYTPARRGSSMRIRRPSHPALVRRTSFSPAPALPDSDVQADGTDNEGAAAPQDLARTWTARRRQSGSAARNRRPSFRPCPEPAGEVVPESASPEKDAALFQRVASTRGRRMSASGAAAGRRPSFRRAGAEKASGELLESGFVPAPDEGGATAPPPQPDQRQAAGRGAGGAATGEEYFNFPASGALPLGDSQVGGRGAAEGSVQRRRSSIGIGLQRRPSGAHLLRRPSAGSPVPNRQEGQAARPSLTRVRSAGRMASLKPPQLQQVHDDPLGLSQHSRHTGEEMSPVKASKSLRIRRAQSSSQLLSGSGEQRALRAQQPPSGLSPSRLDASFTGI
eukprot:TRINITY_DN8539_c0_g1_i2.p1 TRINITY_DN8539_c0_g1~~TRINITY_DN8539_c0_g1_i2.p1  ORF type:complete len:989 (+),score=102.19 TRINITY_DN8539_c0_g1_i2:89-3055(+)